MTNGNPEPSPPPPGSTRKQGQRIGRKSKKVQRQTLHTQKNRKLANQAL